MTEDLYEPDGTVRIEENVKYYRHVPRYIYEITQALYALSEEEQIKVAKYIERLTKKRITFRTTVRRMSKKELFAAMDRKNERIE